MNMLAENVLVVPIDYQYTNTSFCMNNVSFHELGIKPFRKEIKISDSLRDGWNKNLMSLKSQKIKEMQKNLVVKKKEFNNFMKKQLILREMKILK